VRDQKTQKRTPPPLNTERLRSLALHYAGRYATTRAKLVTYLNRKIRERGWDDDKMVDLETMVNDFAALGYVNDAGFAEARSRSFVRRGYGLRRLAQDLGAAGIVESDSADAMKEAEDGAWRAAENFARRKRIGPFANAVATPELKQKQFQAFLRAGHGWELARRFVQAEPGDIIEEDG
jgi:regulatory protein